jgi:carboxymethylenebutenolidase
MRKPSSFLALGLLLGTSTWAADAPAPGSTDAMAHAHAHDAPTATPTATIEPRQAVTGEEVVYATVGGHPVRGYLARPQAAGKALPALLVIHEWWGLNDNVRAMTRRLAGEGYAALAVDLYGGEAATTPDAARAMMQKAMATPDAAQDNLRQAYAYLTAAGAPRVGVLGWCFGGGWSLRTAMLLPADVDAAVIYYGQLETDTDKLRPLRMPVIGFFGTADQAIPVASVHAFEAAMKAAGRNLEIHLYEGAQHAFANPSGGNYDAVAAADAWRHTVDFLSRTLAGAAAAP